MLRTIASGASNACIRQFREVVGGQLAFGGESGSSAAWEAQPRVEPPPERLHIVGQVLLTAS